MRSDHRHLTAYQIGCEVGQSVGLVLRPAILDRHILALDVAAFMKALAECGQIACTIDRPRAAKESYNRHCWLLRPRRSRPRRRRAADQSDELASPHGFSWVKGQNATTSTGSKSALCAAAKSTSGWQLRVLAA